MVLLSIILSVLQAYKQGMFGEHYMWLLLDWYDNKKWWLVKDNEVDCTEEQMRKTVDGYFSIESARIVSNNQPTVSGKVSPYGSSDHYQLP